MRGLSLVVASGDHSSLRCAGLSPSRPLLLRSTGSRRAGSAIVAHGPSCSAVCGIFPDQGSNPRPLHWQADSQPLCHQGSPVLFDFIYLFFTMYINYVVKVYSYICTCIYMYNIYNTCMYIHIYKMSVCVYMYIYIYAYTYTHTHTHTHV